MFVVIYKLQLKLGKESEFRDAWRQATEAIYATRGSLGSQLMKGQDGTYYGVPRWPDRDTWRRRSEPEAADPQASRLIGELTEVSFPPLELKVTGDFLALETHSRLATIFP